MGSMSRTALKATPFHPDGINYGFDIGHMKGNNTACDRYLAVGITIVVDETGRPKKKARAIFPRRKHHAEIPFCLVCQMMLLLVNKKKFCFGSHADRETCIHLESGSPHIRSNSAALRQPSIFCTRQSNAQKVEEAIRAQQSLFTLTSFFPDE